MPFAMPSVEEVSKEIFANEPPRSEVLAELAEELAVVSRLYGERRSSLEKVVLSGMDVAPYLHEAIRCRKRLAALTFAFNTLSGMHW